MISVHGVTSNIFSHESNYFVDEVMRPKFGNCSISIKKVIVSSILQRFDLKKQLLEGWS